jgi:hypothetical protein
MYGGDQWTREAMYGGGDVWRPGEESRSWMSRGVQAKRQVKIS